MLVRAKLFATLRRCVPGAASRVPLEVELPDGATVADLVKHFNLPPDAVRVAFVNGRARPDDWQLEPGDEVSLFPPLGGG
jgi:molybdopterin synthase sulfur carrier subunit